MSMTVIQHPHLRGKKFHGNAQNDFRNQMNYTLKQCAHCHKPKQLADFAWYDSDHYIKPRLVGEWISCKDCRSEILETERAK